MKRILFILMLGVLAVLVSCEEDEVDTEKPGITMEEPAANDTISVGIDEVHIEFTASDNDKLQNLTVTLTSPADSSIFTANPPVSGMKSYTFHQHVTPVTSSLIQLTLTVTVTDASNNLTTTTVLFYIEP